MGVQRFKTLTPHSRTVSLNKRKEDPMRRFTTILINILFIHFCYGNINSNSSDYYKDLKILCDSIKINSSQRCKYEHDFFNLFPKSYKELNERYGYNNLISESEEWLFSTKHITQFFELECISIDSLIPRMINCSINGHWEEEGISMFHHYLNIYFDKKMDSFISLLENYKDEQIKSFLIFLIEGPYYHGGRTKELNVLKDKSTRIHNLLLKADQELINKMINDQ